MQPNDRLLDQRMSLKMRVAPPLAVLVILAAMVAAAAWLAPPRSDVAPTVQPATEQFGER